ncbi:hypothetical protein [Methyloceanibacter caenitepidi]|uniref:Uncharacterized protein n=1 Tax=Methyloceanibacter caenitepidi TaxID=1384459 RepID=A0A0A8K1Y1_9HYPH|nr:hypothetical protein [Methyloceanibacter caenitepidi]BAQ16963.1 hypothetical protein GL4_1507 [Methyloceanibacter caenitepidi]
MDCVKPPYFAETPDDAQCLTGWEGFGAFTQLLTQSGGKNVEGGLCWDEKTGWRVYARIGESLVTFGPEWAADFNKRVLNAFEALPEEQRKKMSFIEEFHRSQLEAAEQAQDKNARNEDPAEEVLRVASKGLN